MTVQIAKNHLFGIVSRSYAELDQATRQSFFQAISGQRWFDTVAGRIFETHALLWFRNSPDQDTLPCIPADSENNLPLRIPVCGNNLAFFSKAEGLKNVDEQHEGLKCLVPVSQDFPTVDAIFLTENFIITVQMTVASTHDANIIGFEKVYQHLPSKVKATRQWGHVFLSNSEDKATVLREQRLTGLPQKMEVGVYSAVIDIEQSASILTLQRVEELNKYEVRRYRLHVIDIDVYW